jgi:hypothetical protein
MQCPVVAPVLVLAVLKESSFKFVQDKVEPVVLKVYKVYKEPKV